MEDFNKLQQVGSLDDYLDRFEELKSMMIQKTPMLPDDFFIDSFMGGVKTSALIPMLQSNRRILSNEEGDSRARLYSKMCVEESERDRKIWDVRNV